MVAYVYQKYNIKRTNIQNNFPKEIKQNELPMIKIEIILRINQIFQINHKGSLITIICCNYKFVGCLFGKLFWFIWQFICKLWHKTSQMGLRKLILNVQSHLQEKLINSNIDFVINIVQREREEFSLKINVYQRTLIIMFTDLSRNKT